MGYVKLDDAFLDHPKFLEAGPLAGYLALCAIAWSNRNRTDGFIPAVQVMRLASFEGIANNVFVDDIVDAEVDARDLAIALVKVGLWEEVPRGYQIHDYLEHQNSAAEIRDLSTARAEAGRKGAEARWGVTAWDTQSQTGSTTDGTSHSNSYGKPDGNSIANECQKEEVRTNENTNTPSELGAVARRLFAYWQEQCGRSTAKFTLDRRRKVEARLREGYTEQQIRQAIDGAARAAFVNDAGKRFDDLELICRSGSKVEDFISRAGLAGSGPRSSMDIALDLRNRGGAA